MSTKQKNILLTVGFVFLIWIAYLFSFSKTIALKKQVTSLEKENLLWNASSENILKLKQQNDYYSSLLKKHQVSTESSFQNNLLNTLNNYCDTTDLKIIEFKDPHRINLQANNNSTQETYTFTIQGSFNAIINIIYFLEQKNSLGVISSISFQKKKDYKNSTHFLQATVFLQKIAPKIN